MRCCSLVALGTLILLRILGLLLISLGLLLVTIATRLGVLLAGIVIRPSLGLLTCGLLDGTVTGGGRIIAGDGYGVWIIACYGIISSLLLEIIEIVLPVRLIDGRKGAVIRIPRGLLHQGRILITRRKRRPLGSLADGGRGHEQSTQGAGQKNLPSFCHDYLLSAKDPCGDSTKQVPPGGSLRGKC